MTRRKRPDLPARVHEKDGSLYLVVDGGKDVLGKRKRTWIRLGREVDFAACMTKYGELVHSPKTNVTLGHIMDQYIREEIPKRAARTQKDYIEAIRNLRHVMGEFRPTQVRPREIYQYMHARGAPVRANREIAVLSNVFNLAIRMGVLDANPCKQVKRNPERARTRYVEDWEFDAVYEKAPEIIQIAMDLAYLTGLRQGDILGLTFRNITGDGLLVEQSKTKRSGGATLLFAWTDELRATIERAKTLERPVRGLYLLCTRHGRRYTADGFKTMFYRAKTAAGIDFRFHDIRAKSGSDHATGRHLGHQDSRTLERHYRRRPRLVRPVEK